MEVRATIHAIDRASQRMLDWWLAECPDRKPGLQTWLMGKVEEAARRGGWKDGTLMLTPHFSVGTKLVGTRLIVTTVITNAIHGGNHSKGEKKTTRLCRTCGDPVAECQCP